MTLHREEGQKGKFSFVSFKNNFLGAPYQCLLFFLRGKISEIPYRRHCGSFYPLLTIKIVLASALIGVQLLFISFTAFPLNTAEAQQNIAYEASGTLSGTLTCPNGDSAAATLSFGVTEYRNYRDLTGIQGKVRIAAPGLGGIDGELTDGNVGKKSFRVTGSEVAGGSCNTLNSDAVLSGKCGTGVTVLYKAEDKVTGKFTGDVNCSTRR